MRELKPCPFCGTAAERVDIDDTDEFEPNAGGSYIFCPNCYASSKVVFGDKSGLEEAWNTRALAAPNDALEVVRNIRDAVIQEPCDGIQQVGFMLTDEQAASLISALIQPTVSRVMLEAIWDAGNEWNGSEDPLRARREDIANIAAKYDVKVGE